MKRSRLSLLLLAFLIISTLLNSACSRRFGFRSKVRVGNNNDTTEAEKQYHIVW